MNKTQFKVGGWISIKNSNHIAKHKYPSWFQIDNKEITIERCSYEYICIAIGMHTFVPEDIVFWQPKDGEWCWSKTFGLVKIIDILLSTITVKPSVLYVQTRVTIDDLEPFIGELPLFLKESK